MARTDGMSAGASPGPSRTSKVSPTTFARQHRSGSSSAARKVSGPFSCVPSTNWPVALMGDLPSTVRQRPTRSKFSSENPIGSMILWHEAQAGLLRCSSIFSRMLPGSLPALSCSSKARNIRRRQWSRHAQDVFENPLAARDGRCAIGDRGHQQQARLAQQATARIVLRQTHAAETVSTHSGHPVVAREAFVDERVVGVEKITNAAVFADDAFKEHLRFASHRTAQDFRRSPAYRARPISDRATSAIGLQSW